MIQNPPTAGSAGASSPHQILKRAGRALKLGRGLTSLAIGLVAAGVVLAAWLLADARVRFGAVGRWAGFVAFALPLLVALGYAFRTWLRRMDEAGLAHYREGIGAEAVQAGCTSGLQYRGVGR